MNFDKVRPNDIIDAVQDFKLNGYPNGFVLLVLMM